MLYCLWLCKSRCPLLSSELMTVIMVLTIRTPPHTPTPHTNGTASSHILWDFHSGGALCHLQGHPNPPGHLHMVILRSTKPWYCYSAFSHPKRLLYLWGILLFLKIVTRLWPLSSTTCLFTHLTLIFQQILSFISPPLLFIVSILQPANTNPSLLTKVQ